MEYAYVNKKDIESEEFPMAPRLLWKHQQQDKALLKRFEADAEKNTYSTEMVEGYDLIHLHGKIYVPVALQARILAWYHEYLAHPGRDRMEQTLRSLFYWKGMSSDVQHY